MGNDAARGIYRYVGSGECYFDPFDANGAKTGAIFLGDCSLLDYQVEDETVKAYESVSAERKLISEATIRRSGTGHLTLKEFHLDNLELAFMGDQSAHAQGTGSGVNEVISAVKKNRWYQVGGATPRQNISAVTVTGPAGTPVYVLGTDYLVDLELGRVKVLEAGAIAEAANIEVDYTYAAFTKKFVRGGTKSKKEGYLYFIGFPTAGKRLWIEVWKASLRPSAPLPLIGDDYGEFGLEFSILEDTTKVGNTLFRVTQLD